MYIRDYGMLLTKQVNIIIDRQNFMRTNSSMKIALEYLDPGAFLVIFQEFSRGQQNIMNIFATIDQKNLG